MASRILVIRPCPQCNKDYNWTEYDHKICMDCRIANAKKKKAKPATPEQRLQQRVKKYNLTVEEYNDLLTAQDHRCKICDRARDLSIDHDHITGKVRGLLCTPCNTSLGVFGDDPVLLIKAIEYLQGTKPV